MFQKMLPICLLTLVALPALAREKLSRTEREELRKRLPEPLQSVDGPFRDYLKTLQEHKMGDGAEAEGHTVAVCNAVRVARDLKAAGTAAGPFAHYVVPPMSDLMRLADCYPAGRAGVDEHNVRGRRSTQGIPGPEADKRELTAAGARTTSTSGITPP